MTLSHLWGEEARFWKHCFLRRWAPDRWRSGRGAERGARRAGEGALWSWRVSPALQAEPRP